MVSQKEIIDIASALGETRVGALEKVAKVIQALGMPRTRTLVKKARQQFESGGMNRADGQGKRTLGGVFFVIAKSAMSKRKSNHPASDETVPKCVHAAHILERLCRRAGECLDVMLSPDRTPAAGQKILRESVQAISALTEQLAALLPPIRPNRDELKRHGDDPKEWIPPIGLAQAGPRGRKGYRARWIGGGMSN